MAEGRLTADELDQRVGQLLEARTRAQAAAVMAGLPALDEPERPHHFHVGHEHDDSVAALPSWLSAEGLLDSRSRTPKLTATSAPAAAVPPRSRAEERAADRKRLKQHGDEDAIGHAFQARRRVLTAELESATASHDRDAVRRLSDSLIVTACGHFPMIESPDAFDSALAEAVCGGS
jgi:pimeloyl-ACP methyl ester carboxylesterase